jgi:hypothetical protein
MPSTPLLIKPHGDPPQEQDWSRLVRRDHGLVGEPITWRWDGTRKDAAGAIGVDAALWLFTLHNEDATLDQVFRVRGPGSAPGFDYVRISKADGISLNNNSATVYAATIRNLGVGSLALSVLDSTGLIGLLTVDGTNVRTALDLSIRSGKELQIWNAGNSNSVNLKHSGTADKARTDDSFDAGGDITTDQNFGFKSGTSFAISFDHALASANRIWTFQDATDTVVGRATVDRLTNKTLGPVILDGAVTVSTNEAFNVGDSTHRLADVFAKTLTLSTALIATANETVDIGTSGTKYRDIYVRSLTASGGVSAAGALNITGSGLSTVVNQLVFVSPKARVTRSSTQSISNNTVTAVSFNSEQDDNDGIYSAGSPTRLTAARAGKYSVTGAIEWAANATGTRFLALRVNGTTYIAMARQMTVTGGATTEMHIARDWDFAASDYVEMIVFQDSGGALNIGATAGYTPELSICKIG